MSDLVIYWEEAQKQLKFWKAKEGQLRKECVKKFFPMPVEGINKVNLSQTHTLECTYKLNRNIDEAALGGVLEGLPEGTEDRLIAYKPSLIIKGYKGLTSFERDIFDEALTIKPGLPALAVVEKKPEE